MSDDFLNADIDALLEEPEEERVSLTDDEVTRRQYLEDVARMRDFRPEAERIRWASPIGPKWKN